MNNQVLMPIRKSTLLSFILLSRHFISNIHIIMLRRLLGKSTGTGRNIKRFHLYIYI